MTIGIGARIPDVIIKRLDATGMVDVSTADMLGTGRIVLFAVPGCYTPTCSAKHLPSFVTNAAAIKAKGVDKIICLSVNDPFVMKAWLAANDAADIIEPLADGNAVFTTALGLTMDGSGYGLGTRSQRFAMVIDNGVIQHLFIEQPGEFKVSSGDAVLAAL